MSDAETLSAIRRLADDGDRSKACTLCVHFKSYQDGFFGDEREPDDCGNCTITRDKYGYPEFASSERTCGRFETNITPPPPALPPSSAAPASDR